MDRTNDRAVEDVASDHPAIVRLRSELAAARRGIAETSGVGAEHRDRIVAAIRTGVPDAAGRAAHEAGQAAAIGEIRRFTAPDLRDATPANARLWRDIVAVAAEAAEAAAAAADAPN